MEYYSTTIVVYWIFACLCYFATLAFLLLDQNAKDDFRWVWILMALFIGPLALIPYWFLGREH